MASRCSNWTASDGADVEVSEKKKITPLNVGPEEI